MYPGSGARGERGHQQDSPDHHSRELGVLGTGQEGS